MIHQEELLSMEKRIIKASAHYGYGQTDKTLEEMGELKEEIEKIKTSSTYDEVDEGGLIEEIADVIIMCWQLCHVFNIANDVLCLIKHKLRKLDQKIDREEEQGKDDNW